MHSRFLSVQFFGYICLIYPVKKLILSAMMNPFLKFVVAILCLAGIAGYGRAFLNAAHTNLNDPPTLAAFAAGGIIYFLLWAMFLSKRGSFWSVIEHEMTHALFALLFFKKVHSFSAKRRRGGNVVIEGDNFIIALAPYFFPLLSIAIVVIKPSILNQYQWILQGLIGFTLMFHLVHLATEFHPSQPDLQRSGMVFSFIVVLFFNLLFVGLCITALRGGWADMGNYLRQGLLEGKLFVEQLWRVFFN